MVSGGGLVNMIDTYDRPGKAFASGTYKSIKKSAVGFHEVEDKPGRRIPKAGVHVAAGVGHARAEWSFFEADAKGPNVGAGADAHLYSGAGAYAKAELASASARAGPVKATVGLAADTGVKVSPTHVEAKVLGTGFTVGHKIGFSLFGNSIEFELF